MAHTQSVSSSEPFVGIENSAVLQPNAQTLADFIPETELAQKAPFEVRCGDGSTQDFDLEGLRSAIIAGEIQRTDEVRSNRSEDVWDTIDGFKNSLGFSFQVLYTPVWAHTMQGMTYGALAGIGLKALDTLILLGNANPKIAFYFLLIIGSLFVARWISYAPIAAAVYTSIMLPGMNLWFTLIAVALVGAIFGGPLGALIGTIVGHFRRPFLTLAPDASQEDRSSYWWGIAAPIVILAILVPLYLLWFMPMAINLMSK